MIPFELVSANSILLQNRRYGLFFYCFNFILQCAENNFSIKLNYGAYPDRAYDSKAVWGDSKKINMIMDKNGER